MKRIIIMVAVLTSMGSAGSALAQDNAGSNRTGDEKVCFVSANGQSEPGLAEALKSCKRGDILDVGWLPASMALQLCDFTKAVLYHPTKNSIAACVYTGVRRPVTK